jgi:putative MFS transporter
MLAGVQGYRATARLLEPHHWFLLWVVGAAAFFEGYDLNIVAVALPQVRHSFHLTQSQASFWLGLLYLGALAAVPLTRRADLVGRRRILLISIAGYTIGTALTALSPTIETFVLCQFVARMFLVTETAVAWTMVAEELPAGARGLGFGWLAMLATVGTGMAALLYGGILHPLGASWRWLYVIALPPLVGIAILRRRLPETRRFELAAARQQLARRWAEITRPPHRHWLILLSATAVLGALTTHTAVFVFDYLETQHHLSSSAATLLVVAAGVPGVAVLPTIGSLSDHYGRKLVGCGFATVGVLGAAGFFFVARSAPALFGFLTLTYIGTFGGGTTLGAFTTELFPTPLRALGSSTVSLFRVGGEAISLAAGGALLRWLGTLPRTALVLGIGPVSVIVLIAVAFPETHGRELEDIVAGVDRGEVLEP